MPKRSAEATAELRAALLGHARRLVERDGAGALTMRGLAAEAGTAVGLPYKVFDNREQLVAELVLDEFTHLRSELDRWAASAGHATVGDNLARYARILLDRRMPAWEMVGTIGDDAVRRAAAAQAGPSGLLASFDHTVADYLAAEQRLGRIAPDVDIGAFAFLITGAIHNLLAAGSAYPRPTRKRLDAMLRAVAEGHLSQTRA
jgi:AcrR family transcriptional regulator